MSTVFLDNETKGKTMSRMSKEEALNYIESCTSRLCVLVGGTGYPIEVSRSALSFFIHHFIDETYALYCSPLAYGDNILFDAISIESKDRVE